MAGEWGVDRVKMRGATGNGFDANEERFRALEARLEAVEKGAFSDFVSFGLDGIKINGGGLLNVSGDLNVDGNLDVTGTADFSGDTSIGGNLDVTGTLSLPAGIIDNDALASPVTAGIANAVTASSWAIGTSQATLASTSIAVPAGFSRALVMAAGGIIFRSTLPPNDIWSRMLIGASAGDELMNQANPICSSPASHSAILTGLSGGSITLAIQARAFAAEGGATGRYAQISGSAVFFR